ncbi:MAG: hypothetical protein GF347_00210 [Candidatus Moranbacteria bacterium]|nr:hypothetical protein [Candidatus Moranbacteria bacterium]
MLTKLFKRKGFSVLGAVVFLSALVFSITSYVRAGDDHVIYVSRNVNGGERTGEKDNPFESIQRAIDKAYNEDKDVIILPGYYFQSDLTIKEGVSVDGIDPQKTYVSARNTDDTVFKMEHKTELLNISVMEGERGVLIKEDARALIWNCRVTKNEKDGIKIKKADVKDKKKVTISESVIDFNGWNGIYSEKRAFYLKNNLIYHNDGDGAEIAKKSKGYIEDTDFKKNDGVGLKLTIDESEIGIEDCNFKNNEKSGLEVRSKGDSGYIGLEEDNKIKDNEDYGISRINEDCDCEENYWNERLFIDDDTDFDDNEDGDISRIFSTED